MTIFWPSIHPSSRSPCRNASSRSGLSEGDVKLRKPIRGTFPALYSCAPARSGAHARTKPVSKRRREITVHPESRRRKSSPATTIRGGDMRERRPQRGGLELAYQRPFPRRAPGGSAADADATAPYVTGTEA